jgi:predicted nucleic acid-binding protein
VSRLVVDASVVVPWLVPEAASEAALRLRGRELIAPDLLFSEAANALWKKVGRGELTADEAETAAHLLGSAPLRIRAARDLLPRAVRLAVELAQPAHGCVYLALAEAEGVPLVSDDRRLAKVVDGVAGRRYRALLRPLTEMTG